MEDAEPASKRRRLGAVAAILGAVLLVTAGFFVTFAARGDYTERSQASEAIVLMSGVRGELVADFQNDGRWPDSLQSIDAPRQGKYTQSIAITQGAGGTGAIELTATLRRDEVRSSIAGRTITMSSVDGGKTWTCRPGTINAKYLPASCR